MDFLDVSLCTVTAVMLIFLVLYFDGYQDFILTSVIVIVAFQY